MTGIWAKAGAALLALALLLSVSLDFANTAKGGAIDLRNRITGARLLEAGIDPYHYKWTNGDPERYADVYNNPRIPVSKTTATPALLLIQLAFAVLPYRAGQMAWFLAQWVLLLGTGFLWWRAGATARQRWLSAVFTVAFTYTAAWRLHAERGQAYVLLAFLFALWLVLTRDAKWGNGFAAGFCAGLLAALRPPFLLLTPFLALHRRGQLLGAAVGVALGVALPMLWEPACWTHYFAAMQTNSELYRSGENPRPGEQSYPSTIEGIPTDTLGNFVVIPYADASVYAALHAVGADEFPALPIALAVVVPFGIWIGLSRAVFFERLLPALAAWLFLVDFFLPAYRNSYNDVLVLNVFAAALVTGPRWPWMTWPCLAALPIGWYVYVVAPEDPAQINLPTLLFALGAAMSLFFFDKRGASRKVEAAC